MPGPNQTAAAAARAKDKKKRQAKAKAVNKALKKAGTVVPKGTFSDIGEYLGSLGGEMAGGLTGAGAAGKKKGGNWGKELGQNIAKLVGFGSYRVKVNSVHQGSGQVAEGSQLPKFTGSKSVRLQKTEFVQNVTGIAATFNHIADYAINPANDALFPWLSRIAPNFQKYRMHGLVVMFKSLSSEYSADVAMGAVIIATNYNVNDSPYTSKANAEASDYCVSSKPSRDVMHAVECDPTMMQAPLLFVRAGVDAGAVEDDRFYDIGLLQVMIDGLPAAAATADIGEIWVSYDIELLEPYISPSDEDALRAGLGWFPTNVSYDNPFGTVTPVINPPRDADYGPSIFGGSLAWHGDANAMRFRPRGNQMVQLITQYTLPELQKIPLARRLGVPPPVIPALEITGLGGVYYGLNGYLWTETEGGWEIVHFLTMATPPLDSNMATDPNTWITNPRRTGVVLIELELPAELIPATFSSTFIQVLPMNRAAVNYSAMAWSAISLQSHWVNAQFKAAPGVKPQHPAVLRALMGSPNYRGDFEASKESK